MRSVAIVGVGLIGGSFGLALRKAGFPGRIVGVSSDRTIEQAIRVGAIDAGATLEQAACENDLIYIAQPISSIQTTLERLGPLVPENCLITDAGSTKVEIVKKAGDFLQRGQFLGGHPMAGKETRGVAAAEWDLFSGRPYVLTPTNTADLLTPLASVFISWLDRCGAHIITVSPEEHDRSVAFTSHLPQLVSTSLASVLNNDTDLRLAGPGLLDMSRLAMSSFDIWQDIIDSNTENIDHALAVYIDKLTELRDNLQTQRLGYVFTTASEIAHRIRRRNNK